MLGLGGLSLTEDDLSKSQTVSGILQSREGRDRNHNLERIKIWK